jgi:hypothetical protein
MFIAIVAGVTVARDSRRGTLWGSLTAFIENGEQCRPAWRVAQLQPERGIVCCCDFAEKSFFVLFKLLSHTPS